MEEPILNAHNKAEYEPAHTAEHILNRTMVNMFGCPRSKNAHIERKKCKCDYQLNQIPTDELASEYLVGVLDFAEEEGVAGNGGAGGTAVAGGEHFRYPLG